MFGVVQNYGFHLVGRYKRRVDVTLTVLNSFADFSLFINGDNIWIHVQLGPLLIACFLI